HEEHLSQVRLHVRAYAPERAASHVQIPAFPAGGREERQGYPSSPRRRPLYKWRLTGGGVRLFHRRVDQGQREDEARALDAGLVPEPASMGLLEALGEWKPEAQATRAA